MSPPNLNFSFVLLHFFARGPPIKTLAQGLYIPYTYTYDIRSIY